MHLPSSPFHPGIEARIGPKARIEGDEVESGADIPALTCVQRTSRLIQSISVSIIGEAPAKNGFAAALRTAVARYQKWYSRPNTGDTSWEPET
jgi:hypothetical protein